MSTDLIDSIVGLLANTVYNTAENYMTRELLEKNLLRALNQKKKNMCRMRVVSDRPQHANHEELHAGLSTPDHAFNSLDLIAAV